MRASDVADSPTRRGSPGARAVAAISGTLRRAGFDPRIGFETDNAVAVEGPRRAGVGVATLPAVDSFPLLPGVQTSPLPRPRRGLHVVTARDAERVPSVSSVSVLGRELAAALRSPGPAAIADRAALVVDAG
jgi:DNA-binding transcriptional LysR family regulator